MIILILYNELRDKGTTISEKKIHAQSTAGMLFFVNLNQFMGAYMTTLLTFNTERTVVVREQANQMYSIMTYYVARSTVETPLFLLTPMIFSLIVYFGVGLDITAAKFFQFYLVMVIQIQAALSWSYFVSAMIANGTTALMVGPIVIFPFMLLGGFFTNSNAIQSWLSYVEKISPLRYGFEALGWNEWSNEGFVCQANSRDPNRFAKCMPEVLGFTYSYWECIIIMVGINIGLRIISAFGLKFVIGKFSQ